MRVLSYSTCSAIHALYILGDKFYECVFMENAKCLHMRCDVIACVVVCSGRGQGEEAEASEEASG